MEMDKETFIDDFSGLFDDTARDLFTPETRFHELGEWSSLIALSLIAMVDEEYGVTLKGDDIKSAQTIQDLFDSVQAKRA